jgi:hypothetical protein
MSSRQFLVKMVTRSPAWSGALSAYGCQHLASAEALFERRQREADVASPASLR